MYPLPASPVIFAHRGASSHAPENTLASFRLAIDQGASAIELDVQLTQDQEVVVFHDVHLNRTTDGAGRIKDFPLSELKLLNAGVSFSPAYQNVSIPTLSEVLSSLPDDIFINIELKNIHSSFDDLPARTASVILDFNAQDRVLISSFNTVALIKFYQACPSVPRGLLIKTPFMTNLHNFIPYFLKNFQSVHLSYQALSPQLITDFKRMGLKVYCYTLNHTNDILRALKLGIDGFFTDDPGFAARVLLGNGIQ